MFDVICVGSLTMDAIAVVDELPGDDQRVVSERVISAGGGPAATAAVALARQGARVGFCGVVGDDAEGAALLAELTVEGVATDWVTVSPRIATARSLVLVSTASNGRAIVTTKAPAPSPASVPLSQSAWIHVDQTGFAPVRAAIAGASSPPPLVSVDAGNPIDTADLRGVELYAPSVAAILAQFPEAGSVIEAMNAAHASGAQRVVATDGANGSWIRADDDGRLIDPFDLDVVSTLGAGDVFHGGLLAAIVEGYPLAEAVRRANATAALSCRGLDGRSAIPDSAELGAFLAASRVGS